jgi:hypothetical protein
MGPLKSDHIKRLIKLSENRLHETSLLNLFFWILYLKVAALHNHIFGVGPEIHFFRKTNNREHIHHHCQYHRHLL